MARGNRDLAKKHRRTMRRGIAVSALLHALVFLVFGGERVPLSPFAAAGERNGDNRAARGGGIEAVQLRSPTPEIPRPPAPVPVPTLDVTEPVPPEEETAEEIPAIALADGLREAANRGPLDGPGLETGEGQGDGGTETEGRFRVVPPRPRGLILPPGDRPDDVRGKEVEVWVFVTARGQVIPDSTRLFPPTGDRRFDRRLREHASSWVFEAARRDGRAVPEWFRYIIVM